MDLLGGGIQGIPGVVQHLIDQVAQVGATGLIHADASVFTTDGTDLEARGREAAARADPDHV